MITHPRLYNGVRLLGSGPSLKNVRKIDMGAMPMISEMAKTGIIVDLPHFAKLDKALTEDMERITEEVHTLTGHYANLGSGDQVAELLFKKLKLKQARVKMTNSGDRESVEDEVLTAIQHDHPVVPKLLEYKEFEKLRGTYARPVPKLATRGEDGQYRVYPNFRTTRVPSGRLSCTDPNLLAIPTRTERGRDIRKGYKPPAGWVFVSVDESQIEVRLAAHSSGDANLMKVYENDEDIYSDFGTTAFSLDDKRYRAEDGIWKYPTVNKLDHRTPAKTCILASIYDVTGKGLLEQMPIICANCKLEATKHTCGKFRSYWTEQMCNELIAQFYMKYPGVLEDRKRHHRMARRNGYVWDMWGRLLHCAAVRSVLPWVVGGALREVGNFPYQSGAQGTIKLAMAEVHDTWLSGMQEVVKPQLQIHDELLFVCREDVAEEWGGYVQSVFENVAPLRVPIKAGVASAGDWGSLEK